MNFKCLFKGHNMHEGRCTQCLKTECEIKGHDWAYSDFWFRRYLHNDGKYIYPKERICTKCGNIERLSRIDDWVRIQLK